MGCNHHAATPRILGCTGLIIALFAEPHGGAASLPTSPAPAQAAISAILGSSDEGDHARTSENGWEAANELHHFGVTFGSGGTTLRTEHNEGVALRPLRQGRRCPRAQARESHRRALASEPTGGTIRQRKSGRLVPQGPARSGAQLYHRSVSASCGRLDCGRAVALGRGTATKRAPSNHGS